MYLNSYQLFIYKLHCAIYLFLSAVDHKSNMLPCVSSILSCYPCPWLHSDLFNRAAFLADYSSNQMLGNRDKLFANLFINVTFQIIVSSPAFVREFVEGEKVQTILSVPKISAKFRQRLFQVQKLIIQDKKESYKHVTQITSQVWMGSHFHDWIDYNGVSFSVELLEWGPTFSDFWGKNRKLFIFTVNKRIRIFVL